MLHRRTPKKTVERLIAVMETLAEHSRFDGARPAPDADLCRRLATRLRQGARSGSYDLDAGDARLLVAYLEVYNLDVAGAGGWDQEVEKLSRDLQKAYAKHYGGSVYGPGPALAKTAEAAGGAAAAFGSGTSPRTGE